MSPRVRARSGINKAPMRGRHDHEAGPSHRRTPSATFSSDSHPDWRNYLETAKHSVSLSSSPSYHNSFGPDQEDETHDSHHSYIPLQRSDSHHYF
ncbi:hypothetical protein Hanom_Chr06g00528031 [Helianthus anomalus]